LRWPSIRWKAHSNVLHKILSLLQPTNHLVKAQALPLSS
jgi:hypothetical protein